jgi:hypothetical protein
MLSFSFLKKLTKIFILSYRRDWYYCWHKGYRSLYIPDRRLNNLNTLYIYPRNFPNMKMNTDYHILYNPGSLYTLNIRYNPRHILSSCLSNYRDSLLRILYKSRHSGSRTPHSPQYILHNSQYSQYIRHTFLNNQCSH